MNTQPIEKQVRDDGTLLAVNSIFHTIQGEGPFAGSPAIFVRLAGCNLQCPMCDTEYTNREPMLAVEVARKAANLAVAHRSPLVVITGGEPFRQNLHPLVSSLLYLGVKVQIETNGTLYGELPFGHPGLTIVCSPKAGAVNKKLTPHIRAYKYVATADSLVGSPDGLPTHALEHPNGGMLARPPAGSEAEVYLQPVDEKNTVRNNRNLTAVVESCLKNGYRLCLQVHKLIGVD